MKKFMFIFSAIFVFQKTFSQTLDSSRLEFFPLHLGDVWQYYIGDTRGIPGYIRTYEVIKVDTLLPNGNKYYQINDVRFTYPHIFYRVDSLYQVWEGTPSDYPDTLLGHIGEYNFYRLSEKDSAVWEIPYNFSNQLFGKPFYFRNNGIFLTQKFGISREVMVFQQGGNTSFGNPTFWSHGHPSFALMRGVGIYYEEYGETGYKELTGAVINGMKYGTIKLSVQQNKYFPVTFQLFQNYPNPFNPTTNIEYALTELSNVRLTVFDHLGREIALLVNREQAAGFYSVTFDASKLSSGVYFYRITAGRFSSTKRMLLLK